MNILITNDDGVDAPGLQALAQIAPGQITIVAPAEEKSECGHQVTTRAPIRLDQRAENIFAVWGSPVDCVRLALTELCGERPDWVFSGINYGGNLGVDTYMSGTVAAAREATLLGVPAIAVSHYRRRGLEVDWSIAQARALPVIETLLCEVTQPGELWNVNLPHLTPGEAEPGVVHCAVSRKPMPVQFQKTDAGYEYCGVYPEREREPGSDVECCFGGDITVSKLTV